MTAKIKMIILMMLMLPIAGTAQIQFDAATFQFTLIDSVKGSKNELFIRANEWVAKTYNSAQNVVQMSDKEAGKIIGKGVIVAPRTFMVREIDEYIRYTIAIDIKDGKYRCVLSDFYNDGSNASASAQGRLSQPEPETKLQMTRKQWNKMKATTELIAKDLLDRLKKAMTNNNKNDF